MRFPGSIQKRCSVMTIVMIIGITAFILGFAGPVLSSSGGEHDEHAVEAKGWVATDTYRVMNFAVLAIGLFLIARKPVAQAFDSRIKGIKEELSELEAKKQEAEKTLATYNEKLALLDKEAEQIISQYIEQGKNAKKKILEEASIAAEKLEDQAKRTIAHEFKSAKMKLKEEIAAEALVKAEELVKNRITPDDQDNLVDEYLDKVVLN